MGIIVAYSVNKKANIKALGNILDLSTLFVATGRLLAEKIAAEKNISMNEAEKFVIECVSDGMKTIKNSRGNDYV